MAQNRNTIHFLPSNTSTFTRWEKSSCEPKHVRDDANNYIEKEFNQFIFEWYFLLDVNVTQNRQYVAVLRMCFTFYSYSAGQKFRTYFVLVGLTLNIVQ